MILNSAIDSCTEQTSTLDSGATIYAVVGGMEPSNWIRLCDPNSSRITKQDFKNVPATQEPISIYDTSMIN